MTITQQQFNNAPQAELPIEGQVPIRYRLINGTAYHEQTPFEVVAVLEAARGAHARIRLDYGFTNSATGKKQGDRSESPGQSWGEVHDIAGYLGRSNGTIKVPILLYSTRSIGGGSLLDDCIVAIFRANKATGTRPLYQHPSYTPAVEAL